MSTLLEEAFEALRTRGLLGTEPKKLADRIDEERDALCRLVHYAREKGLKWVWYSLESMRGQVLIIVWGRRGLEWLACNLLAHKFWEQERQHLAWWLWGELNNGGGEINETAEKQTGAYQRLHRKDA